MVFKWYKRNGRPRRTLLLIINNKRKKRKESRKRIKPKGRKHTDKKK